MFSLKDSKMHPKTKILTVAHSPDPDDAFMFYGMCREQSRLSLKDNLLNGFQVTHVLKDIQSLNKDAVNGKYHITAISTAAYPRVADKYWILSVGSSVGRGYGPVLVCHPEKIEKLKSNEWSGLKIAVPGPETTAFLLLRLFRSKFRPIQTSFERILPLVNKMKVDAGLLIHEGQITYQKYGLMKVIDLGQWWAQKTNLPIPLGLDVVRKDMGRQTALHMANILYESIRFAYKNKRKAISYALKFGRGINASVGERFVKMYVNKDTLDMGIEGEKAIKKLFQMAHQKGLLTHKPIIQIIHPSRKKAKSEILNSKQKNNFQNRSHF